jgi:glycosyl transferase family 2
VPIRRPARLERELSIPALDVPSPRATPLVSIGLPTYNGARHLRGSLESLLAQDYADLEILVSDNASTDGTGQIARRFAERDPRVRVIRQATNIGPTANFWFVLRETRGRYFMWAADDDVWDSAYVSACVGALEGSPGAVMATTLVDFIDGETNQPLVDRPPELWDNPDLSSTDPAVRIGRLMSRAGWYQLYGLMRREVVEAMPEIPPGYGWDVVFTAALAARGPIVLVDRSLFTYRVVRQPPADRGVWNQDVTNLPNIRETPYSHLQEACCAAVASAGLGWWQHQRAHVAILIACYVRDTPMRARIEREVEARLRIALATRRTPDVLKYGTIMAWKQPRRFVRKLRRRLRLGRRRVRDT